MRIGLDRHDRAAADLTARARIRDAAIECFAREGFDAPFRTIAAQAGVSPGLITHHFRAKEALRAECDTEVLHRYRDIKNASVAAPAATLLANLTSPSLPATVLVYMLRAIHAGAPGAHAFLDQLIDDMRPVMAESVATGMVRPSRDEEARLRYLIYQWMGALLVQYLTSPDATPEQFVDSLRDGTHELLLPMLELFTEGFLADHSLLDTYVEQVWEPAQPTTPAPGAHPDASDPASPAEFLTKE